MKDYKKAFNERVKHMKEFKESMCSPNLYQVTFCDSYKTDVCPETCNYANKLEKKLNESSIS